MQVSSAAGTYSMRRVKPSCRTSRKPFNSPWSAWPMPENAAPVSTSARAHGRFADTSWDRDDSINVSRLFAATSQDLQVVTCKLPHICTDVPTMLICLKQEHSARIANKGMQRRSMVP